MDSWAGGDVTLSAADGMTTRSSGVQFAPWAARVCDPADGLARAEHLATLQNFLATHEFRGATGRLQRLAVVKRLSRLGAGDVLQSLMSSASAGPAVMLEPTTAATTTSSDCDDLATQAWGAGALSTGEQTRSPELEPEPEPVPKPELAPPTAPAAPTVGVEASASEPPPIPTVGAGADCATSSRVTMALEPELQPPAPFAAPAVGAEPDAIEPPAIPTVGAGAASASAGTRYVCKRRAVIRSGFEITSGKVGTLERDTVIDALEERPNEQGTLRVHFSLGWVSKTTGAGLTVLVEAAEQTSPARDGSRAAAAAPAPAVSTAPSARVQQPVDGATQFAIDAGGPSTRYCKKCKLTFSAPTCPGGHANFMYTKTLPT